MDLKSAISIILDDLKEAGDLIEDLKNKPELPELQIELARSKCKSAEDLLKLISELVTTAEKSHPEEEPEAKTETEEEPEAKIETKEESKAKTEAIARKSDPVEAREEDDILAAPEEKQSGKEEKILADKFSHLSGRINEKVGDSKKAEGKTRTVPVKDLNRALGINDRFYYIRELFNGNEDLFKNTINKLNDVTTRDEAEKIINETVKDLSGSEPALELLDLVERKLSSK